MGKILDKIKKGNVELKIPDAWSRRKTWYVGFGLISLSTLLGSIACLYGILLYLYLCMITAFCSGQMYYIVHHWDELQKIKVEKDLGKCIYLIDIGEGQYCSKGFTTMYKPVTKLEPICKTCRRKTVIRKNGLEVVNDSD